MRYFFNLLLIIMTFSTLTAQHLDVDKIKEYEHHLDDVMEIIDVNFLKSKLSEVEETFKAYPNELNKIRLGIIYHEAALNLSFFAKEGFTGYAQKSYDLLDQLYTDESTTPEFFPFIASYRASALSLVSGENKKLKPLANAFRDFKLAVDKYAGVSYCPEFMRGSVAENLPWIFFLKRRFAKRDMQSIIDKQQKNEGYANWKIMSFVYWAWANQHQSKKYRKRALEYLALAIKLDPRYRAGRRRAEELRDKLTRM